MHILLIHQAFAAMDEPGGTRHIEFANALVKHGHLFSIIASNVNYLTGRASSSPSSSDHPADLEGSINVIRLKAGKSMHANFRQRLSVYFGFMLSSFRAALKIGNVDVVWGTSPPLFQAFSAMRYAKFKRIPFIFEVRDLWPDFAIELGVIRNRTIIALSRWLERRLIQQADVVIVNSPGYVDHVRGLGARRVELIPNGVDPDMFDPGANGMTFRLQHRLTEKYIVCYLGAHGISNDLDVALKAAHNLSGFEDIHFLFVGDGKEKQRLVSTARQFKLDNVTFLPATPKAHVKEILAAANACLAILKPIPMYKTTYPNKVFDYMAAGKPVLCAIDGVIREVVENSGAGLFIQPGDPDALSKGILYLHDHPGISKKMGINGRKSAIQDYNRKTMSGMLANVICSIKTK